MRMFTDKQVERMAQSLLSIERTIHYCSAITADSDYIPLEGVVVHSKELQNIPYRDCGLCFEVLYMGKFRKADKTDFTIDNHK